MTVKKFNQFYKDAEQFSECLLKEFKGSKKSFANKNLEFKNGKWQTNYYPNFIISLPTNGTVIKDIDINLEPIKKQIYIEFFVKTKNLTNENLESIIQSFHDVEIYGGDDCTIDFYNQKLEINKVSEVIKKSNQKLIGFSLILTQKDILASTRKIFEIFKKSED